MARQRSDCKVGKAVMQEVRRTGGPAGRQARRGSKASEWRDRQAIEQKDGWMDGWLDWWVGEFILHT